VLSASSCEPQVLSGPDRWRPDSNGVMQGETVTAAPVVVGIPTHGHIAYINKSRMLA
jgi:hypothetical protein